MANHTIYGARTFRGLFFFAFGMACRLKDFTTILPSFIRNNSCIISILAIIATFGMSVYLTSFPDFESSYLRFWEIIEIPVLVWSFFNLMPKTALPFAKYSFPVYLIHYVLFKAVRLLPIIQKSQESVFVYFASGILVFCFSIVLAVTMTRFMPRISAVLFGGRGK